MFKSRSKFIGLAVLLAFGLSNVSQIGAATLQPSVEQHNGNIVTFTGFGVSDSRDDAAFEAQMDAYDQLSAWVLQNPGVIWVPWSENMDFAGNWEAECTIEIMILF